MKRNILLSFELCLLATGFPASSSGTWQVVRKLWLSVELIRWNKGVSVLGNSMKSLMYPSESQVVLDVAFRW